MDNIIKQKLNNYDNLHSLDDKKNALKEVIQEVTLCGLSRSNFFNNVAFYGGTALRIFYNLDRFSEDLDFSLCSPNNNFNLETYFPLLKQEINAVGLNFEIEEKIKSKESNIKSAFLKGNTKEHILTFYDDNKETTHINKNEILKIKFEVDTNPPKFANYETKIGLFPSPYEIKLYDGPSLFAGKIHAVICRAWQNRIKGRDLYDYVFYLSMNTKVNLKHLQARLLQSKFLSTDNELSIEELKSILNKRFLEIDYEKAKEDVLPFIKDKTKVNLWSAKFFIEITKNLQSE